MSVAEVRHFHLFCGLGGGAAGFNQGQARVGSMQAEFRCIGGVDSDPAAIADFEQLAKARGTVLDLFDRQQYTDWHGSEPPEDWREATPADIRNAAGNERPHIVFTSAPCKGFSGLLSQSKSGTQKYQALNRLTLRGVWLTLEAWDDDPPEFILFENVPRIATRGRDLIDQITALLRQYGYAVAETTHDCGELGGLAQSRRRFLLVARHQEKIPPFLYEPEKRPLRAVGDVLGALPLPGDPAAGPMHRVPRLQWKTWVRLALVEAGSDWRSLERLRVEDGYLADYAIAPEAAYQGGVLGVRRWEEPTGTVTGRGTPTTGAFSVADPRFGGRHEYGQYGVRRWQETAGAVSGQSAPGGGRYSVADPRCKTYPGGYGVLDWKENAGTVAGESFPSNGRFAVADPRGSTFAGKYRITPWDSPAGTVISGSTTGQGAFAIADPRPGIARDGQRPHYQTGGHYGVVPWYGPAYAVPGHAKHDRGPWSVADPRQNAPQIIPADIPKQADRGVFVIRSLDNTWHRPFTTLELAALQGLVDPDEHLELQGNSDSAWRERIGNAVPAPAAAAIAGVMGTTLLLAWAGETFVLNNLPIWVRPVAVALSVAQREGSA